MYSFLGSLRRVRYDICGSGVIGVDFVDFVGLRRYVSGFIIDEAEVSVFVKGIA